MQKKKNIRLLILFSVLLTGWVFYTFIQWKMNGNEVYENNLFSIEDSNSVNIVKINRSDATFTLSYEGVNWKVNSKYNADNSLIKVFFAALTEMRIRRPLSALEKDSVNALIIGKGTKVEFYSEDHLIQSFYTYGDEENSLTYITKGKDEMPFLINIPGYRTYLYGIFQLSQNEWRDPLVFRDMNWRNLGSIEVEFPDQPENSFSIKMGNEFFKIDGITSTDTTKLIDYIDKISLLQVKKYTNGNELEGKKKQPSMIINVLDVGLNDHKIYFYPVEEEGKIFMRKEEGNYGEIFSEDYNYLKVKKNYFEK
ncbi:MAG: hypothetical protein OEY34_05275 [Cyclobacteriaceae bacterium]|nr:hypothetical protein [Cyclobacteriaceae bacterium]